MFNSIFFIELQMIDQIQMKKSLGNLVAFMIPICSCIFVQVDQWQPLRPCVMVNLLKKGLS